MDDLKKLLTFILCLGFYCLGMSQEADTLQVETRKQEAQTINYQFNEVYRKSGNYKDENGQIYEVARQNWLRELQKSVIDSLTFYKSDRLDQLRKIEIQQQEIDSLTASQNQLLQRLEKTQNAKDNIGFLGFLNMHKNIYRFVMWLLIILFLVLFGLYYFKYKESKVITDQARNALKDLEEEYETHRQKALEREQKAMRKLQDEINKNKYKNK